MKCDNWCQSYACIAKFNKNLHWSSSHLNKIWQFIEIQFGWIYWDLQKILWFSRNNTIHDMTWLSWYTNIVIDDTWTYLLATPVLIDFFCITLSIWVFNYISLKPFVWLGFHFYWLVAFWIIHKCILYTYIHQSMLRQMLNCWSIKCSAFLTWRLIFDNFGYIS